MHACKIEKKEATAARKKWRRRQRYEACSSSDAGMRQQLTVMEPVCMAHLDACIHACHHSRRPREHAKKFSTEKNGIRTDIGGGKGKFCTGCALGFCTESGSRTEFSTDTEFCICTIFSTEGSFGLLFCFCIGMHSAVSKIPSAFSVTQSKRSRREMASPLHPLQPALLLHTEVNMKNLCMEEKKARIQDHRHRHCHRPWALRLLALHHSRGKPHTPATKRVLPVTLILRPGHQALTDAAVAGVLTMVTGYWKTPLLGRASGLLPSDGQLRRLDGHLSCARHTWIHQVHKEQSLP